MTKTSKQHAEGTFEKGTWLCKMCGSESLDFELFEESGEFEKCMARRVVLEKDSTSSNKVINVESVDRVRKAIEDAKISMDAFTIPAEKAGQEFMALSGKMKAVRETLDRLTVIVN